MSFETTSVFNKTETGDVFFKEVIRSNVMFAVASAIDTMLPIVANRESHRNWMKISRIDKEDYDETVEADLIRLREDEDLFTSCIEMFEVIMQDEDVKHDEEPVVCKSSELINSMNTIMRFCVPKQVEEEWLTKEEETLSSEYDINMKDRVAALTIVFGKLLRNTEIKFYPKR